jgi:hypothetical protein
MLCGKNAMDVMTRLWLWHFVGKSTLICCFQMTVLHSASTLYSLKRQHFCVSIVKTLHNAGSNMLPVANLLTLLFINMLLVANLLTLLFINK